ncbi:exodeoxyribonuclease VII small subunit [bacterium]|nr:exodeoxyribonuclease VII small subunit [bacterium]
MAKQDTTENKTGSFTSHYTKIETLVKELETNKISVDELIPRLESALDSLQVCKSMLSKTQLRLSEIKQELEQLATDELPSAEDA